MDQFFVLTMPIFGHTNQLKLLTFTTVVAVWLKQAVVSRTCDGPIRLSHECSSTIANNVIVGNVTDIVRGPVPGASPKKF